MAQPNNNDNAVQLVPWYMSTTTRAAIATAIVFATNTLKISADPDFVNTAVNWFLDGAVVIGGVWTMIAHWRAKRSLQAQANQAVKVAVLETKMEMKK